jgi:hypothetical protein
MDDVDPNSGLAGKGHILVEGGDIYNVDLALQVRVISCGSQHTINVLKKIHWRNRMHR